MCWLDGMTRRLDKTMLPSMCLLDETMRQLEMRGLEETMCQLDEMRGLELGRNDVPAC
jgi:hypothetical protein